MSEVEGTGKTRTEEKSSDPVRKSRNESLASEVQPLHVGSTHLAYFLHSTRSLFTSSAKHCESGHQAEAQWQKQVLDLPVVSAHEVMSLSQWELQLWVGTWLVRRPGIVRKRERRC